MEIIHIYTLLWADIDKFGMIISKAFCHWRSLGSDDDDDDVYLKLQNGIA
jgi:hypothetical protein